IVGYFRVEEYLNQPIHPVRAEHDSDRYLFEVQSGQTLKVVVGNLKKQDLISDAKRIYWLGRLMGVQRKLKAAEYEISPAMSVRELLLLLSSGRGVERKVVIPEGHNIFEISEIFEREQLMKKEEFLRYVSQPEIVEQYLGESLPSLEGYLFPSTYHFFKGTKGEDVIRLMVQKFFKEYKGIEGFVKKMGWTRHQVVTLASIIEKETGAPWERGLISSVFHNRLQKKMKLQTDPTILYAKALMSGVYELSISRSDLSLVHPYNTYQISGLPPGPIGNPGAAALRAAVQPEPSNFLYFVSRNDGTHVFSVTYQEHLKAVRVYQLDSKMREGRSWRDLKERFRELETPSDQKDEPQQQQN
ncbi:MAG: endolytic transglycosylase MltG, partial [Bdellovibrionaceae bacterium]|nr:endolytic transglycosylase MltG [Pseudobdellovibrionaceae bacterium]MDW8190741.1 endolytic transglycosylase MltG [Pseudobdellovibrionaceae bacterium]